MLPRQNRAVSPERLAAFHLLLRIEKDRAFSDHLLQSSRLNSLDQRSRAQLTELVMGCLRRQGELDYLISSKLRKPMQSLDAEVLTALRLGVYQLHYMDTIPAHAAVFETVELVKSAYKRSASGLVNAVLRNLPPAMPEEQAARLSHPDWLVRRWESSLGVKTCKLLLQANLKRPETYLRFQKGVDTEEARKQLDRQGVVLEQENLPGAYRVISGNITRTSDFSQGSIMIQDLNSQRIPQFLEVRPEHKVLDLCAAPGGKARLLAETAPLVAADRHPHRLRTMRKLGCQNIQVLTLDAEQPLPFLKSYDRILVDVPCSGTGTLARNPEIKWRLEPEDLEKLHTKQVRILQNALPVLAPDGKLLYSTCSLEPEENEDVVKTILQSQPSWTARQVLSTMPGTDPGDGFHAWILQRQTA